MKYIILLLTLSVNTFAANSKFDDPDFEDTVFVCEEKLIPDITRKALQMPSGLQSNLNRYYQLKKKREEREREKKEKEIQDAMIDAFDVQLDNYFSGGAIDLPLLRYLEESDTFEEVTDSQIEEISDSEFELKIEDPVWFDENIRKPYAKHKAKEMGVEYIDTGDLKRQHEEFFKTPIGIVLKKYGIIF